MVVDETVLARHYPLGDLVSHIVGYVGPIITEELRDDPATGEPHSISSHARVAGFSDSNRPS